MSTVLGIPVNLGYSFSRISDLKSLPNHAKTMPGPMIFSDVPLDDIKVA
jgi:hypothetical protein